MKRILAYICMIPPIAYIRSAIETWYLSRDKVLMRTIAEHDNSELVKESDLEW